MNIKARWLAALVALSAVTGTALWLGGRDRADPPSSRPRSAQPTLVTTPTPWSQERFDVGAEGPLIVRNDGVWTFSRRGRSTRPRLIRIDPDNGEIVRSEFAGEPFIGGLVVRRHDVWTVTNRWDDSGGPWRAAIQRWDRDTLELLDTYAFHDQRPTEIVIAEGALWITNVMGEGPDEIWKMDPATGRIIDHVRVGAEATGIVAAGSALWVPDSIDGGLWKVDPSSSKVVRVVWVDNTCHNLTSAGEFLWIACSRGLTRINSSGTQVSKAFKLRGVLSDITLAFGRLWVLDIRNDTLIGIDPRAGRLTGDLIEVPDADSPPSGLGAGNGSLFVTSVDGLLTKISP